MNKTEVIAPIVHAARVAYRQVHAPGKLLPDWGKAEQVQKNEVFEMVRTHDGAHPIAVDGAEAKFLASVSANCHAALFPVAASPAPEAQPTDTEPTPEPAPRRGRR